MTDFSDLNDTERAVLADLVHSSASNGHDFGFTDDVTCVERKQIGAYVSSLSKKGYVDASYGHDPEFGKMFQLTDRGHQFAATVGS